jgi:voltage-gated potassium channel
VLIVVVSVLPLLRPLRLVRAIQVLRLARLVLLAAKTWSAAQRVWGELRGKRLLFGCGIAGVMSLFVVYMSERAAPDSSIHSAETTLWWAVTTVTTVGYGDTSPVTLEGRIAAGLLMLAGISIFGVITANISARFISQRDGAVANFCPTCGAPLPRISVPEEPTGVRDGQMVESNAMHRLDTSSR